MTLDSRQGVFTSDHIFHAQIETPQPDLRYPKYHGFFFSLFVGGVFSNNHTLATNLTCYSHIRVAFNEVLACVNICA